MPELFIDEFVGISNRLETLPLAFAIRKAHGHDIVLDWHELDSFFLSGTGDPSTHSELQGFETITLNVGSHYHYALGPPSDCIVPLPGATRDDPRRALVRMYGARLPRWRATARNGADSLPLSAELSGLDLGRPADTGWL